ncbi:hypothetical protein [Bacillus sp. GB_SG_008]|uniref:hypothetical protein n=1 Tax=Bacillus sp. GB_SG_008 TaxID=3454627 RepID=UPI003F833FA4
MVRKNFKMFVPRYRTISINGAVLDVDISHDEFVDELIEWVESKGWAFLGLTEEITEEEAKKIFIDLFEDEEE